MKQLVWMAMFALLLAPLTGCGKTSEERLQEQMHDEIARTLETPGQDRLAYENTVARTLILNERAGQAEWRRLLLLDRPVRDLYYPYP